MKIGIKYCGGCNARYDRVREIKRLQERFPDCEFIYDTSVYCPIWLIVCGCQASCCPSEEVSGKKIIRLNQQKDFLSLEEDIRKMIHSVSFMKQGKRVCFINETSSCTRTFSEQNVSMYAHLTGDSNGIHTDPAEGAASFFHNRVVHGQFVSSMLSAHMGTQFPGSGTILLDEQTKYTHPVFIGDTITANIILKSFEEHRSYYIATFSGVCTNQNGLPVIRMTCRQLMTKNIFKIQSDKTAYPPAASGLFDSDLFDAAL